MEHDGKPSTEHAYRTAPAPRAAFEAWVDYTPVTLASMKQLFPEYQLTHPWHGLRDAMEFEPTEACQNVSRVPRMVAFEYVRLESRLEEDEVFYSVVLHKMRCLGLRPALPEEEVAFLAEHRSEHLRHPISALGAKDRKTNSFLEAVAYAGMGPGVPGFCLTPDTGKDHCQKTHYLAVRE